MIYNLGIISQTKYYITLDTCAASCNPVYHCIYQVAYASNLLRTQFTTQYLNIDEVFHEKKYQKNVKITKSSTQVQKCDIIQLPGACALQYSL